jgi:uncharacterized glyoxalase superfamily protein PhnB
MSTVTAHLWFNGDCGSAIDFYETALDATPGGDRVPAPDGSGIRHAMLRIGDADVIGSAR